MPRIVPHSPWAWDGLSLTTAGRRRASDIRVTPPRDPGVRANSGRDDGERQLPGPAVSRPHRRPLREELARLVYEFDAVAGTVRTRAGQHVVDGAVPFPSWGCSCPRRPGWLL